MQRLVAGATSAAVLVAGALAGCAVGVRRDLSKSSPNQVIIDDQCHLQEHFDAVAQGRERPPLLVRQGELQTFYTEKTLAGTSTFRFGEDTSLRALRRILVENWKPIPPAVMTAREVDVEVRWYEKHGARWVVTSESARLRAARKTVSLFPHPCLTALLFGQSLYERRQELLDAAAAAPSP